MKYPYYYAWKNNPKRAALYRKHCRILARGALNSCLVEFEPYAQHPHGTREIISRNALRKVKT